MKKLLLIIFLLPISLGCNADFITDNLTDAKEKFGYYSRYTGYINEAHFTTDEELKTMAKEIQPIIDYANAISLNTVYSFTPDVLSDNASIPSYGISRQDNSTCEPIDNSTFRTYNQYYKFYLSWNEEYITYNSYCYQNRSIPPSQNTTTGRALTRSVIDNNSTIVYYMLFDNLTTSVSDQLNGFNGSYTLFGILDRVRPYNNGSGSNYRLGLDYTSGSEVNRFDLTFDTQMKNRELKYFSSKYGYVTVSLNQFTNKISQSSRITYKYGGGSSCTFTVSQIDTPIEFQKDCIKK